MNTFEPWTFAAAWSSGTVPAITDTAVFDGTGTSNTQIPLGTTQIGNVIVTGTGAPTIFAPTTTGTYNFIVSGTFSADSAGQTTLLRNGQNAGGVIGALNFTTNVLSATNGTKIFLGNTTALTQINSVSATTTLIGDNSEIALNVTTTASLGDVTMGNGALLLLGQQGTTTTGTTTVTSLNGSGTIENAASASNSNNETLILTTSGTTATYGGLIRNNSSGTAAVVNLIMNGSGTQIFTGNNTYSGTTQLLNGTLQLGDGTTNGSLATAGPVILSTSSTLAYFNTGSQSAQSSISGTGSVIVLGGTTVFLGGTRTYSGTTTINSGAALQIGQGGGVGTLSQNAATVNNGTLIINRGSGTPSYSNVISGTGSFQQIGSGTMILSGNNTYTGATIVSAGSLLVTGGLSNSTAVTVARGATFAVGMGAGGGAFKTLAVHSLDTGSGASLESVVKLDIGSAGNNDAITMGAFTLNGQPVNLVLTSTAVASGTYTLMTWTSGGFTDLTTQLDIAGSSGDILLTNFSISGDSLLYTVASVPEPTSLALLGAGSLAVVLFRRKRRSDS